MKKKSPEKVKPSLFSVIVFITLIKIYVFFSMRVTYDRKALRNRPKRGSILIYNHYSNKDHFLITSAIGYRRINYVLSGYFYYNPKLVKFLNFVRAIKKEQFKPDLLAIRKIKKVIDQKGLVAISPTGQVSIHGNSTYISPAIIKLIRFCNCDVIGLQIRGSHLCYPKWRTSERRCRIDTKFVVVLTKEEIPTLTDEEIYERVAQSIDIREYEDQKVMKRVIKGEGLMEGLENVLVVCPKCHQKYTNVVNKNEMKCTNCGNHVRMDQYGFLHGVTPEDKCFFSEVEWYEYQKEFFRKALHKPDFKLQNQVDLFSNIKSQTTLDYVGSGVITLTNSELFYEGTIAEEKVVKYFKLDQLTQLPFAPASHFEVPDYDASFKFVPTDNIKGVMEWVIAIDIMHEERHGNK